MSVNKRAQLKMSLLLSSVMDEIGVNEEVIVLRRNVHSFKEKIISVIYETLEYPKPEMTIYIAGSQVEGSTTDGMCSDTDTVYVHNYKNVCLAVADYKANKMNVLAVKDEQCSPQCCLLQLLIKGRDNVIKPAFWTKSEDVDLAKEQFRDSEGVSYETGQMLMSNLHERLNLIGTLQVRTGEVSYSGPAINLGLKFDFVYAITCQNIPNCCNVIFDRPRPGHWPKQETLKKLKEQCIFLVPNGPPSLGNPCLFHRDQTCGKMTVKGKPNSLRGVLLWRYTTNLTERFLMFDLNIVQMKAYVVTKMIKKECFAPIVGDSLSTFHLKTALLFTIELFPPDIWTVPFLLVCVIKCLLTLKRFLKRRYCPHYTISGVNLFSEKLSTHEYKKLVRTINTIISENLKCMFEMKIDNIGERLKQHNDSPQTIIGESLVLPKFRTIPHKVVKILLDLCFHLYLDTACEINYTCSESMKLEASLIDCAQKLQIAADINRPELSMFSHIMYSFLASLGASSCLEKNQKISECISDWYQSSISSNLICNRLKYASFLYCSNSNNEAAIQLDIIDRNVTPNMVQSSPPNSRNMSASMQNNVSLSISLAQLIRNTAMCVYFSKQEINCIPWLLKFEMFRTLTPADKEIRDSNIHLRYMDLAVVDSIPFLYYLQYLTFRRLGNQERRKRALEELKSYQVSELYYATVDNRYIHGHFETTSNMLAHCFELEGQVYNAIQTYKISLKYRCLNNAASWHIFRLLFTIYHS